MIKRIISIGSVALMLLSVLVVMDIVPVMEVEAETNPPYDLWDGIPGNGIWGTDGDWTLTLGDSVTHTNPDPHTIIVNGNLTIEAGASLTLQGVTLKMATPDNGTFGIRVEPASSAIFQAELIIENQGATPSIITSNITDGDHRFGFVVEAPTLADRYGPLFEMRNSELHECGWNFSEADNSDGGLWIGTGNFTVDNNVISDNYAGMILYGSGVFNPTVTNNDIYDNTMAPGIYLFNAGSLLSPFINIGPGNTATNNFWGVFIRSSVNVNVHNNTLNNNGEYRFSGGMAVDNGGTGLSSDIYIQDNVINGNAEYSLNVVGSILGLVNDVYVYNNDLYGPTNLTNFEYVSGLEIKNNNICQGGALDNVTYFLATTSSGIVFDNNVVSDNIGIGALFNVCQATVTNNVFENNPAGGFGLQYGSFDSEIHNNTVRFNGDMGLHLVASNLNVSNNLFEANGDGSPYQNDPVFQDCGIDIMNSEYITLYDNDFIQNIRTTGPESVNGIYLLQSSNINLENNNMDQNNNNLYCRGDATAIEDNNSTYTWSGGLLDYDVCLEDAWVTDQYYHDPPLTGPYGPNHVTFLNVSFDKSRVRIEDSISGDFTVKWYKHIIVEDNMGNPVSGATVYINDSNGDPEPTDPPQPYTTNARGMVTFVPLTEYVENNVGRVYYTPHDIEASEGDRVASDSANMANSHYNTLVLNERPIVTRLEPAGGAIQNINRTETIIIEAEFDDTEDSNEENFAVYFEFREPDDSVWIDETSTYFGTKSYTGSGETTIWRIEFTPPETAMLGLYDFRVRCEDSYPSSSDWLNSSNSVNVLNNLPNAEDILVLTVPPEVYRGQSIDIYADASDIEDIDEDTTWNAELQYLINGSGTWSSAYITLSAYDSISGNWKFEFSPPASSPDPRHGLVDFQVRFQDSDGDWSGWLQEDNLVDVLNNPPQYEDPELVKDSNSVYRGNTIRIYANVSDEEESEENLYVHFYYSDDGSTWVEDWLSTPNIGPGGRGEWDPFQQRFFVEFTPPDTADIGSYYFRLYIADSDGGYITFNPSSNVINVMNNPPIALYPVSASGPEVRAGGGYVYIYINADDYENAEDLLTLRVQQRFNETGNPPDVWFDNYIYTETYEGTPPTGRLRANFTPLSGAQLGWYDFRAWVEDDDGAKSNYVYLFHAVEVLNPEPTLEDISLGMTEVYRGDILYIYLNASDLSDDESELSPEIQYLPPDGSWTDIPSSRMTYNAAAGCWVIEFIPADNANIGTYYFRARVKNTAQGYSDQGAWEDGSKWTTGNIAQVKNSKPVASNLGVGVGGNTVERGDTINIFAEVTDAEFDPDEMTPHFEYREEGGSWEDEYLGNLKAPSSGDNEWRITFSPPEDEDFTLGDYDFRVWFEDDEDNSNIVQEDALVNVLNVKPTVEAINVEKREGYRSEPILITADGSDPESGEAVLTPTFEYSIDGVNWVGVEDSGSYFQDTPQYVNNQWQITFEPDADAELDKYSFRVKFSDGVDESDWMTKDNYYDLKNNEPEVEITSPSPGVQSSAEVSFFATATDDEDTSLTWEWDFGDGSEFSNEESPTHTYDKAGDYRVTLKVTDSDGDDATHYIDITIEAGAAEEEFPMVLLLLLLIIIIVVVLLLVLLLTKKKKKPEEIPPAVPGMAPGVPGAPPVAPPAAPGAAPPGAPPAAIPAAIPAAVPAGPPKEAAKAGQQIKCPKCGTGFTVESAERPITIECPNCHAKGKLT